jgi:UDP-glucose 4-epimerase
VETILVTGACGGIGSKLIPVLLNLGYKIIAVDNLYSGSWVNLETNENLLELTLDISDVREVNTALSNYGFNYCIHLAAISSLPECQINPTRAFEVNFIGTQVIAELCMRQMDFRQFIFASTSAVYEGVQNEILTEDIRVSPLLVYPQSKYFSERFLISSSITRKFPMVILRFFNVFGDRQNALRKSPPLINYLVREISNGRSPILFGWNAPGRDYISVDTVNTIVSRLLGLKESYGNTYNVCSGKSFTVREIYSIVSDALNSSVQPVLKAPTELWSAYSELQQGEFPLGLQVVESETNKRSLGSPKLLSEILKEDVAINLEDEISRTAISISLHLGKMNP